MITSSHNFIIRDEQNGKIKEYTPIEFTILQPKSNGESKLEPKRSKIETLRMNMQFVGILNSAVVFKNMYYNEPNEELQLVYYNQVLDLESKGI